MPLTPDPASFFENYYVPVRMCGSAVGLVFLPDKLVLLCILLQSGKYDGWNVLPNINSFLEVTGSFSFTMHTHTHFIFHVYIIAPYQVTSVVLLIIILSNK